MSRRSLTLLETLIALTLVLAMAALIIPSMLNSMEERNFEAATDVTKEQLMMARAHAQATGNPVEVTYRPKTSQVQARWFMPWLDAEKQGGKSSSEGAEQSMAAAMGVLSPRRGSRDAHSSEIAEPWATREIGKGIRIASHPPTSTDADAGAAGNPMLPELAMEDAGSEFQELETGQEVRLAVFMPDGSALMGEPVFLNDEKGRCGKFIINPWSGLPIFERLGELAENARKITGEKAKDEKGLAGSVGSDSATGLGVDAERSLDEPAAYATDVGGQGG